MKGGARYLSEHRYTQGANKIWSTDAVSIYLGTDGQIVLAVRTNNLEPAPHLNRRWIMVDVANSLFIMDGVRAAAQKPTTQYSLFLELRYDDHAEQNFEPVRAGQWRLCTLEDDAGQMGTLVPSTPIQIGPFAVGTAATFPEVLMAVYVDLVTSAHRTPERDLSFELRA